MGAEVLWYVPNIIGYFRLVLLALSWVVFNHADLFLALYIASALLDGVDGIAARKLNQTSAFGAWLDVFIDLIGRGMLWCNIYHCGFLIISLEWTVFVCTHSQGGAKWKSLPPEVPWLIQKVMEKNFKTPMGFLVIGSVHLLPVWLYAHYYHVLTHTFHLPLYAQYLGIAVFSIGRALALVVELWFIWSHITVLLNEDGHTTQLNGNAGDAKQTKK